MPPASQARDGLMASLRREVGRLEGHHPLGEKKLISTGAPALDRLLPAGGLRPGTLVEYLSSSTASGAGTLALSVAREACRQGRALVVMDHSVAGNGTDACVAKETRGTRSVPTTKFYPPAAAAWGIELSAMLVLRPVNEADAVWALDQALRCPGVGAVWAACDRLDVRDFRRLQLAAECGGTLGLLMRPGYLRGQPTWADVQLEVRSTKYEVRTRQKTPFRPSSFVLRPWTIWVELVRCRGGTGGKAVILELDEKAGIWREVSDEATRSVPVSAAVGDSTSARRA